MMMTAATTGDPALLHALCALSALHQALVIQSGRSMQNAPSSPSTGTLDPHSNPAALVFFQHKARAIELLRSGMAESTKSQYASSIAIVALLLLIEIINGERSIVTTHRHGLLELLGHCPFKNEEQDALFSDVLMIDVKTASLYRLKPSVVPPRKWIKKFGRLKNTIAIDDLSGHSKMASAFFTNDMRSDLGIPFVLILSAMRQLVETLEASMTEDIMAVDIDGTQILTLEYELLAYAHNDASGTQTDKRLIECCRVAALLYCNLCIWTWPKGTTLVEGLLSQLRVAILDWTLDPISARNDHLLLWLYFLGTMADSSSEDGHFFRWGFKVAAQSLKRPSGGDLEEGFRRFFYSERMMGPWVQKLLQLSA